jgi:hypothetical protein
MIARLRADSSAAARRLIPYDSLIRLTTCLRDFMLNFYYQKRVTLPLLYFGALKA